MSNTPELEKFLKDNRISNETWQLAKIEWEELKKIAEDHDKQLERLRDSAEFFARVIQRFPGVHSVRWRIKDKHHLLEKIIRKRAKGSKKYSEINSENYFETVTDLVGLRALHLFKDECFAIDQDLRNTWTTTEEPTAYIREGDPADMRVRFEAHGFKVENHPEGYRSIHYVFSTKPLQRQVFAEIQVRTIFEEGWSEIDHHIRYPNFSNDQLVSYFLTIFNRLAGSADEMGTFVQNLTDTHDEYSAQITIATREKEEALIKMSRVVDELNASKRQDQDTKNKLTALQQEITKLRMLTPSQNISPEKSAQTKTNSPISLHNNFMNARKVLLASQVRNPQRTLLSQPQVSLDANGKTPTSNTSAVPVEPFIKKKTQHLKSAPHISNTSTPSSPTTSSAEKELGFIEVEHKNQE